MRRITESFLHGQPLVPPLLTVDMSTTVSLNLLHQTFGLISNVVDLFNSSQIQQNSAIKRGEAKLRIARSSFYSMSPLSMVPLPSISSRSKASSATFKKSHSAFSRPPSSQKLIVTIYRTYFCVNFQCFVNSLIHFFSDDKSSRIDN